MLKIYVRLSCLTLVGIGVMWVPIIQNLASAQLFTYMQQVQNILSPPVSAVYLLAVFWPRCSEPVSRDFSFTIIILPFHDLLSACIEEDLALPFKLASKEAVKHSLVLLCQFRIFLCIDKG